MFGPPPDQTELRLGRYRATPDRLFYGTTELRLPPRPLALLRAFFRHPERIHTREELDAAVWQGSAHHENNLDQQLKSVRALLRSVVGEDGLQPPEEQLVIVNVAPRRFRLEVHPRPPAVPARDLPAVLPSPVPSPPPPRAHRRLFRTAVLVAGLAAVLLIAFLAFSDSTGPLIQNAVQITHDGRPKSGPVLVDGPRIYFMENSGSNPTLVVATREGTVTPLQVPIPDLQALVDIDLRTGELIVEAGSELWRWLPGSAAARKILGPKNTHVLSAHEPGAVLGAVGSHLVWLDPASGAVIRETKLPFDNVEDIGLTRYSPDDRKIRFNLNDGRAGTQSLWETDRGGADPHRLPGLPTCSFEGFSWAAGGRWFVSTCLTPNRSGLSYLAARREQAVFPFLPAPVFVHRIGDGPIRWTWPVETAQGLLAIGQWAAGRIEAMRLDLRTGATSLLAGGISAAELDYSRDGQWIVYADDFDHSIWKVRADGTGKEQVTAALESYGPHWSPDGARIAFMGHAPGDRWRVYVISSSGGEAVAAAPMDLEQGIPTWSPDGHFLVFGERARQRPAEQMAIHMVDTATGHISQLPGSAAKWTARWSPDGRSILAQSVDWKKLFLFDVAQVRWRAIAAGELIDHLAWSPDSRYVFFSDFKKVSSTFYRSEIATGRTEAFLHLRQLPDFLPNIAGIMPDGSPVLNRQGQVQEIYSLDVAWP